MVLTQPFGYNVFGPDYSQFGMAGHNGLDLRAPMRTECFASCNGQMEFTRGGTGYGNEARIFNSYGYEVIYGHLDSFVGDSREVKEGELIGYTGNTGFSTAPHLHFGLRRFTETADGSRQIQDYGNGYRGGIDPTNFFDPNPFLLPVDKQYGEKQAHLTTTKLLEAIYYFRKTFGRYMNERERNAIVFGYWGMREVVDPTMYDVWTQCHKPEAIKRGLIKA